MSRNAQRNLIIKSN